MRRTLARLALLGSLLLAALLPPAAAAQWSGKFGLADASYTSPAFGFGVRWHTEEWSADQPTSDANGDLLLLRGPDGNIVRYLGTTALGDDPGACLDAQLASLKATGGVSEVTIAPAYPIGSPRLWFRGDADAYGLFAFRRDGRDWLAWFDCQTLVPGTATLAVSQVGPVDSFDNWLRQANRIVPDRRAVAPYSVAGNPGGWLPIAFCWASDTLIDSGKGSPFADAPAPAPGSEQQWFRLRWYQPEDRTDSSLQVDASAIFLLDTNDVVHWPTGYSWSGDATGTSGTAATVASGTGADLTLLFEVPTGTTAAQLFDANTTHGAPTLAFPIGCVANRNGDADGPHWPQPDSWYGTSHVSFVLSPDGDEQGMVLWLDSASDHDRGSVVLLRFVNTGAGTWQVDPAAVSFGNNTMQGSSLSSPDAILLGGDPADPGRDTVISGPVSLAPGEAQTLAFTFPDVDNPACGQLQMARDDQIIPLGNAAGLCGMGGGGTAAIIRTGE